MLFFILNIVFGLLSCLDNGVGITPALGWNSWNKFACNLDESVIKSTADQIVNLGLKAAGYVYVNVCFEFFLHFFF
jgi:alpha-galactosidase